MQSFSNPNNHYFKNFSSIFFQEQYLCLENSSLFTARVSFVSKFSTLGARLQFDLAAGSSPRDLARVLYIFFKLFAVKPAVRLANRGGFNIFFNFRSVKFSKVFSTFFYLKFLTRSKFLNFFVCGSAVRVVLAEPLTFFPLVSPFFDYHDWIYPFSFHLSVSPKLIKKSEIFALDNLLLNLFLTNAGLSS
jgi:hypothetical protein